MNHSLLEKLEQRLFPELEEIAEKIRQEIMSVQVEFYSTQSDNNASYAIHCYFSDYFLFNPLKLPDILTFDFSVSNLLNSPKFSADVYWEHYKEKSEAEFSTENLEQLYQDLPRIYEALFEALRRRKPKDLC